MLDTSSQIAEFQKYYTSRQEQIDKVNLTISNLKSRYCLKYGMDFKDLLDARDRVLEHQFNFNFDTSNQMLLKEGQSLMDSNLYTAIKMSIKDFLAEAVGNIISVAFKFLCKNELDEREAMQFAAKNILLNLNSIYKTTIEAVAKRQDLLTQVDVDKLREHLIIEVDDILNNILLNLADCYPQAPASGGTPRMKEAIQEVNRASDEQNDFIFTCGIKISDYLDNKRHAREDEDYTQFIMRVINASIQVSQDNKDDMRERTVFQKFTEFNEHLFWLVQQKPYQKILNAVEENPNLRNSHRVEDRTANLNIICRKFSNLLDSKERRECEFEQSQAGDLLSKLWQQSEEGISEMKAKKKYALGQKIPASVKVFNRQELMSKQFIAKHSSILRILTKWAGYLERIFENSQEYVKGRLYAYTNINNQLVNINSQDIEGGLKLIRRLGEEYREVKRKLNELIKVSYDFIGKFMSHPAESFVSSVTRFTQTRTSSSKINAVLTSLMLNYTNLLIHHLIKAGEQIRVDEGFYKNINLVVFRVSDLLRSKFQCSQSSFINILKTMYLFDNNQALRGKFKLVRIKNKLDDPANNIIINYLFMNRVQCQLQLSIQDVKGKEKNYYIFSHLMYELTRGKFGAIAQCAIMLSQLDPMITACNQTYYQEKHHNNHQITTPDPICISPRLRQKLSSRQEQCQTPQQYRQEVKTALFQCCNCGKLIINEHPHKLMAKQYLKTCYSCILKKEKPQLYLNSELKNLLYFLGVKRLHKYQPLENFQKEKYLVIVNPSGQLSIQLVLSLPREFKTFCLKVTTKVLESIDFIIFDGNSLDYIDISKQIKKGVMLDKSPPVLTYIFQELSQIPPQIFQKADVKMDLLDNMRSVISEFKEFRQEKSVIKTIKYKAEIIKANKEEWGVIDGVCKVLVLGDSKKQNGHPLKYTKYKNLDLSNLKKITANEVGITAIPRWLRYCKNLKILELEKNQIQKISKEDLPTDLVHLNLLDNGLKEIDISGLTCLNYLHMGNNQLTSFNLAGSTYNSFTYLDLTSNKISNFNLANNQSLKVISICYNSELQQIGYLPPSLETLGADRQAVINYDFSMLINLKKLIIFSEVETHREDIINIREETEFQFYSQIIQEGEQGEEGEEGEEGEQIEMEEQEGGIRASCEGEEDPELENEEEEVNLEPGESTEQKSQPQE